MGARQSARNLNTHVWVFFDEQSILFEYIDALNIEKSSDTQILWVTKITQTHMRQNLEILRVHHLSTHTSQYRKILGHSDALSIQKHADSHAWEFSDTESILCEYSDHWVSTNAQKLRCSEYARIPTLACVSILWCPEYLIWVPTCSEYPKCSGARMLRVWGGYG